jgi:hypothetical protein
MACWMIFGMSKFTPLLSKANKTNINTIPRYGFSKLNTLGLVGRSPEFRFDALFISIFT